MKRVKVNLKDVRRVVDTVSQVTGIDKTLIYSKDRHNDIAIARFMIYYIMWRYYGYNCSAIGRILDRTHATVIHGIAAVNDWSESNKFRDRIAIRNWNTLTKILNKLKLNE